MICSVQTLGITGIRGSIVTAECYISSGLPGFDIVGLPDAAVKEARDRVRAAAKSSGLGFPASRITVNLAPAGQRKAGTHYDLPILLGILAASGEVRRPKSACAWTESSGAFPVCCLWPWRRRRPGSRRFLFLRTTRRKPPLPEAPE